MREPTAAEYWAAIPKSLLWAALALALFTILAKPTPRR